MVDDIHTVYNDNLYHSDDLIMNIEIDSRFRLIDMYLHYWGQVRRQDLQNHLAIGSVTASRALKLYTNSYPDNVTYSVQRRAYVWGDQFEANHLPSAEIALNIMAYGLSAQSVSTQRYGPDHLSFSLKLSSNHVGIVTRAMVIGGGISIEYVSNSSGASIKELYPHAIFESNGSWYFRAFDIQDGFRTFRFNRIKSTRDSIDMPDRCISGNPKEDIEWNSEVVLTLGPHSQHPKPQALKLDLGLLDKPVKNLRVNSITAPFILTDLRVDCSKNAKLNPHEYPLQLMNRSELLHLQGMLIAPGFGL